MCHKSHKFNHTMLTCVGSLQAKDNIKFAYWYVRRYIEKFMKTVNLTISFPALTQTGTVDL